MLAKSTASGISLCPHFKTHFSAEIAELYRELGVTACSVSSVEMAQYFAENDWDKITIAFPYNPLESNEINQLASNCAINIFIESEESLKAAKEQLTNTVGFYLKIDVGSHRTGIDPRNESLIKKLVDSSTEKLCYKGVYAHAGHTYGCNDLESIQWIFDKARKELSELKNKFSGKILFGDTPSCSLMEDFSWCDELRPGNFIFYDWMQKTIGSCTTEEIAVCLAAPVVAVHPERSEVVIHGGAVHLSKDAVTEKNQKCYGKAVSLTKDGWNTEIIGSVTRLSQEHGVIKINQDLIKEMKIGSLIGILPVHSCLAADLQGHYIDTSGARIEKMRKS